MDLPKQHLSKSLPRIELPALVNTSRRWSSTGTLYIDNTLHTPDSMLMLTCVAATIQGIMATSKSKVYIEIFDERKYPLGDGHYDFVDIPTISEVIDFLTLLTACQELAPEVGVMACTYIDRLISYTGTSFTSYNWRRIVLGAILVADKVVEEHQVWNVDYKRSLPKLSILDLNSLERVFLGLLKFQLTVKSSLYATYYFGLRAVAGIAGLPVRPLDWKTARKLEVVTSSKEELARQSFFHETKSKTTDSIEKRWNWSPLCLEEIQRNSSWKVNTKRR